jgi:hypothetical protein
MKNFIRSLCLLVLALIVVQVMVPMISAGSSSSTSLAPQKALFYDSNYITSDRLQGAAIPSLNDAKAAGITLVGAQINAEMDNYDYIWQRYTAWASNAHALGLQVFLDTSLWNLPLTNATAISLMRRSALAGADFIAFDELIYNANWAKQQFDACFKAGLAINSRIQFIITEWQETSMTKAYNWFSGYSYVRFAYDGYNDLSAMNGLISLSKTDGTRPPILWLIFSKGSQNFNCYLQLNTWMAYAKQKGLSTFFFKIDESGTWKAQWSKVVAYKA